MKNEWFDFRWTTADFSTSSPIPVAPESSDATDCAHRVTPAPVGGDLSEQHQSS